MSFKEDLSEHQREVLNGPFVGLMDQEEKFEEVIERFQSIKDSLSAKEQVKLDFNLWSKQYVFSNNG